MYLRSGICRPQALGHGLPLARELRLDLLVPFRRMRLDTALGETRLYSFNVDSYKPSSTIERYEVVGSRNSREPQAGQRELGLVQFLEGLPEMQKHEIALVADKRVDGGLWQAS